MGKNITSERLAKIKHVLSLRQKNLTLVLANIHDPHNVSAIYRSADAFGIDTIHLYYTDTPFPKLGSKSSASAKKWVKTVYHQSANELIRMLKEDNYKVIATSCTSQAQPLLSHDFTGSTAIIMGNEHSGVPPEFMELVNSELYIPMYGMIQSFNVSVAAAIILAEASRQRLSVGMYNTPTYTETEFATNLSLWINK